MLLQVVLNSCIGAEHRDFTDRDVTSMAAHKMITRHAHVFGAEIAKDAGAVNAVWERAKARERGEQTALERVRDVAVSLPALSRAQKSVKRLAQAEGRRNDPQAALSALRDAVEALSVRADETAVSDALMAICTLSDAAGVDAETALRAGIGRLIASLEAKTEKKD